MQINSKMISIPPYISVTWDKIFLIKTEQDPFNKALTLILQLKDGQEVKIPALPLSLIELVFEQHRKHMEQTMEVLKPEGVPKSPAQFIQQLIGLSPDQLGGIPIRFGITGVSGIEGLDSAMQHNPQHANLPNLPEDVLEKITGTTKMILGGDLSMFPKPEAHCNCAHCQVSRAMHGIEKKESNFEEPVTEEDLTFRDWEIMQIGEELYEVTNPLDMYESYHVFLGKPVGCTCGQAHCEHIKAVLSS